MNIKDFPQLQKLLQNFDPDRMAEEVAVLGETWADQDAAATSLEESKKTFLAQLQTEYAKERAPGAKPASVAQTEISALADPRYSDHLTAMVEARRVANRAKVRYDMGKTRLELYRSLQSTLRQEMAMSRH